VASTQYLADTSVFARLTKPGVTAAFAPLAAAGRVTLCPPVTFEVGFTARNQRDYEALVDRLFAFPSVQVTDADHRRALDVQAHLCARGQHRAVSLVDALVAAIAEARDMTVLHYDADFELVARVTKQEHQWVVKRGTAD
jgi:predicted nucleic acid-binding protein